MIPREVLKPGQIGLCRTKRKNDWLGNAIGWFTWGQTRSQEFSHVFTIFNNSEIAEQFFPKSAIKSIEQYDQAYDNGEIVILEPAGWSERYAQKYKDWVSLHLGMSYGLDDIGRFAADGFIWRVLPWWGKILKGRDLPEGGLNANPSCGQWAAMMIRACLWPDFPRSFGIGKGREVPGDYYTMAGFKKILDPQQK